MQDLATARRLIVGDDVETASITSNTTSVFAGSRDARVAPLRESRKAITQKLTRYMSAYRCLSVYDATQRESDQWQDQSLEADEERVIIINDINEWVLTARLALDPADKADQDVFLNSVVAYILKSKKKLDASDFLNALPAEEEHLRPKLMTVEEVKSCKRPRPDETVDTHQPPLKKGANYDASNFTNDMDAFQIDVNPNGVATTTSTNFLSPYYPVGGARRKTKYGPNARRTSTPELNGQPDLLQQYEEIEASNAHIAAETARLKKQTKELQEEKERKQRESEERLRRQAAEIQRKAEAKKVEEKKKEEVDAAVRQNLASKLFASTARNAEFSTEYQQCVETYQLLVKEKAEDESREKEAAKDDAGLPENVDENDHRPFQLVEKKKKTPSKSPKQPRSSAEAQAARQGLSHSPTKDVHMDSYAALPPPRMAHVAQSAPQAVPFPVSANCPTPNHYGHQPSAAAGVWQQQPNFCAPPPANVQPMANLQPGPNVSTFTGYYQTPMGYQQQQQQSAGNPYGQWVQQTNDMNDIYRQQLQNAAMESAARLASTSAQCARDARPNAQRRFAAGTAMEYKALIHRFELAVNQYGMDSRAKMTEMQFWFTGHAAKIIDCYMSLPDADLAYTSARSHLDHTFGSTVDSLTPLIEQLISGGQIGEWDLEAHVAFSVEILQAETMAFNIGRFAQLDTRENIFKIVKQRLAYMRKELLLRDGGMQGESPTTWINLKTRVQSWIRGLASERSALPQNKPTKSTPADPPAKSAKSSAPQFSVLATETTTAERQPGKPFSAALNQGRKRTQSAEKCAVCGSVHTTSTCATLAKMPMEKRMSKIRELRLCVHCLKTGHEFRDCTEVPVCSVTGCGRKHHHLFHNRPTFASLKEARKLNVNVTQTAEVDPAALGATAPAQVPEETTALISLETPADLTPSLVAGEPVY